METVLYLMELQNFNGSRTESMKTILILENVKWAKTAERYHFLGRRL